MPGSCHELPTNRVTLEEPLDLPNPQSSHLKNGHVLLVFFFPHRPGTGYLVRGLQRAMKTWIYLFKNN